MKSPTPNALLTPRANRPSNNTLRAAFGRLFHCKRVYTLPNIRSQSISADGLEIVASDGRSISLTRADVLAHFQSKKGGRAARIQATIDWVKAQIEAALRPEQVPAFLLDFDFDDLQGLKSLALWGQR